MVKKASRRSKKVGKLFLGIVVAVAVILSLAFLRFVEIRQDANRFAAADRVKQTVFNDLIKQIGVTPIQIEEKDVCYNSEQGPYDDGRLWCQVASAAYFTDSVSQEGILERFKIEVTDGGYDLLTNEAGDVAFRVSSMSCGLDIYDGVLAVAPGYFLPENASSIQTVVVKCADRAKAKHYPYVDF